MKLSEKEARVLVAIELQPDLPLKQIQQQTGYPSHVIRYAIHRLETEGIVRRLTIIDMFSLGYEDYGLYFSVGSFGQRQRDALLKELRTSAYITWLVELGGDFQYCAAVYARTVFEFRDFVNALSVRFPNPFFHKSFSARVHLTRFNHQYLAPDIPRTCISTPVRRDAIIDDLDRRILTIINAHPTRSQREWSTKLGIAFSTLNQRIKRLEEQGVIRGAMFAVDASKIEMSAFQLLVFAKGMSRELNEKIFQFAKKNPSVVYFVACIGEWDFEIGVEVAKQESVREIVQEIHEQMGEHLTAIKVLSMFQHLKFGFYRVPSV